MKKEVNYEVIRDGITDSSDAPQGDDIFYQCKKCGGIIPSTPKASIGCQCYNLTIDKDMHRFCVFNTDGTSDYSSVVILRKKEAKKLTTDIWPD